MNYTIWGVNRGAAPLIPRGWRQDLHHVRCSIGASGVELNLILKLKIEIIWMIVLTFLADWLEVSNNSAH